MSVIQDKLKTELINNLKIKDIGEITGIDLINHIESKAIKQA